MASAVKPSTRRRSAPFVFVAFWTIGVGRTLERGAGFCAAVDRSPNQPIRQQPAASDPAATRVLHRGTCHLLAADEGPEFRAPRSSHASSSSIDCPEPRSLAISCRISARKVTRRGFGAAARWFLIEPERLAHFAPGRRRLPIGQIAVREDLKMPRPAHWRGSASRAAPSPSRRGSAPTRAAAPRPARTRTDRSDRSSRPRPRRAGRAASPSARRGAVRR